MEKKRDKHSDDNLVRKSGPITPQADRPVLRGESQQDLGQGELIDGRYRICGLIGQGGAGRVYLVEQVFLKKKFALKTLNQSVSSDKTIRRFQQEAQSARSLNHPNLVRAVDFGLLGDGHPYFVMDLVEGDSLALYLKRHGTLSVDEAVEIFVPLCAGLGFAHSQGIIHRDIKPGNIVLVANEQLTGWVPKIVDFGIARWNSLEVAESLTKTGDVFGTPLYMSPEQCAGAKVDERSDIYSLGCVLFEMLTGGPPFNADTALAIMMQHDSAEVPALKEASLGREFPKALESIIAKALSKEPSGRYQNCAELSHDLQLLQLGKLQAKSEAKARSTPRMLWLALIPLLLIPAAVLIYAIPNAKKPAVIVQPERAATPAASEQIHISALFSPSSDSWPLYRTGKVNGSTQFEFPKNLNMGTLYYWQNGQVKPALARNGVEIPAGAKPILVIKPPSFVPADVIPFRNGDLWGADLNVSGIMTALSSAKEVEDQKSNLMVQHLFPILSLRYLSVKLNKFNPETYEIIGKMPNLCWLRLDCTRYTHVNAKEVSRLQNFQQMEVLSLYNMDSAEPILQALRKGPCALRRLALCHSNITDADLIQLSSLRSLTHLNLIGNFCHENAQGRTARTAQVASLVSKLPNLEYLAIDPELSLTEQQAKLLAQTFSAMPRLKTVAVFTPTNEGRKWLDNPKLPFRLIKLEDSNQSLPPFEPMSVEPGDKFRSLLDCKTPPKTN